MENNYGWNLEDDFIAHYGKGHDDSPPGRGSGRYPWGSGAKNGKTLIKAKGKSTKSAAKPKSSAPDYNSMTNQELNDLVNRRRMINQLQAEDIKRDSGLKKFEQAIDRYNKDIKILVSAAVATKVVWTKAVVPFFRSDAGQAVLQSIIK
jgi:hypothetical protein